MGTADYIAPEQAGDAHSVDIRADLYSLGCTLYKLLSGRVPFSGPQYRTALDKLMAHCRDPIPPIRQVREGVPEDLAAVLQRMLAKDPAERFATPGELAAAIAPFAAGADLTALLARADEQSKSPPVIQQPSCTTIPQASSAVQGTAPLGVARRDEAVEAVAPVDAETITYSPKARSARWRRVPRWAIAAGLLPVLFLLGVVIWINNTRRIEAPDGSDVRVAPDGTVMITLPDGKVQVTRPQPQPASRTDALPAATVGQRPSIVPGQVVLTPEPLEIATGEPLSRTALVLQPAPLKGLQSWTIETIAHRGSYPVAAFSPDGQTVATVCTDPTIRFWNVADGRFLRAIVAHGLSIVGLAWCPDGRLLATASADRTVRIWEVATGRRLATFVGESAFRSIDWSSDPRYLAAGCRDGTVHFWEFTLDTDDPAARTPREGWRPVGCGVRTRKAERPSSRGISVVRWSPDGKTLATGNGLTLRLWDGQAGTSIPSIQFEGPSDIRVPEGWVSSLAWSPDGSQIVTSGNPPRFYCTVTGELLSKGPDGMNAWSCVAWSPDGSRVTGRYFFPSQAFSFKVETGTVVVNKPCWWMCNALAYSPDGNLLVVSRHLGRVELCEADSAEPLHVLPAHTAHVEMAAWSPDAGAICTSSTPGNGSATRLVRMTSAETIWETAGYTAGMSLTWSMDAKWVKAGDHRVYDGISGQHLFKLTGISWRAGASSSPTEAVLATFHQYDPTTKFFDMSSGEVLRELPGGRSALTWSPDGKSVAVAADTEITLRDAHSFDVAATITAPAKHVMSVLAWSPDGSLLAAGMTDGKAYVFDIDSGKLLRTWEAHTSTIESLAWFDGGSKLASGTSAEVRVWDAAGDLLRTIPDDCGTFSPDGHLVASRGDSSLRLWNLEDGRYLRTLLTLRNRQYAAVSPEGHYAGSPDAQTDFVYIVQTDEGQQTLTPTEFAERYGWKNDPAKVQPDTP